MTDDFNGKCNQSTLEELAKRINEQQAQISSLCQEITRLSAGAPRSGSGTSKEDLVDRRGVTANPASAPSVEAGPISRRGALLALGGVAAGGVGMALGSTVLGSQPAYAADGNSIAIGQTNAGEAPTWLHYDGTSSIGSTDVFTVYDSPGPLNTSSYPAAIAGWAVNGPAEVANGVYGFSAVNSGFGSIGVASGDSTTHGVFASSTEGYGLVAIGGLAPIRIRPAAASGAPTSGTHALGELFVDTNGVLYRCVAAGTPGTWVPNFSVVPLANPVRVISTPSGNGNTGGLTGPFSPTGATNTTSVLTGGSTGIPASAVGAVANLTISAARGRLNGDGYLTLFPAGTSNPGTASIYAGAHVRDTSNGVTVAFGTGSDAGKLSFSWQGAGSPQPCQFFLDVTAYIL
jgi:hypothetical protein